MVTMNDKDTTALAHVAAIPPYPPGRPVSAVAREFGLDPARIVKLASNENPMGCSPKALEAIQEAARLTHQYPDFDCHELRELLAAENGVETGWVLPGAGSSDLILQAARGWLGSGRNAVIPQYSFASYESGAAAQGAAVITVPARGWDHDLDALVRAVTPETGVLFLATPNNPIGTAVAPAVLEAFLAAVPDHVLVVLDEAYREFLPLDERPDLRRLLSIRDNLLVLRTFSKIHGLAALRVGYGVAHPSVISILKRLQLPFAVSTAGQMAAVASLRDPRFTASYEALNRRENARLSHAFAQGGFDYVPSRANFILFHVGDGPATARALMQRGVITRPVANYGLKTWLRVSIGLEEENDIFLGHLRDLLPEGSRAS